MTSATQQDSIRHILQSVFGYSSFRDRQEQIIQRALTKKDCLVIMPTGGGKSLCFQIPALAQEGLTVVISPLIALMSDQVMSLKANNIEAAFVNSTQSAVEKKEVFNKIESGALKLLYISPEKALGANFLKYIAQKNVSLLAIDEAHCVSIWGNDFRPEYAKLRALVKLLPNTPVMALTATADKATQTDIIKQLGLRDAERFVSSFERKNIQITVQPGQRRIQKILDFLDRHPDQPGIIYCLSRRSTEALALKLRSAGFDAAHYHAEIPSSEKKRIQAAFQKDELKIICATIAFGMGIDKSNVRWVIHYNLPKNIESYYQEIGRAGRDGAEAKALLFYSYRDISVFRTFIDESNAHATFKMVQHAKLDRIWEMTQASNCRTNLVLSYFGEFRSKNCGHCDNCLHPPVGFDGTEMALQALTACKESKEKIGIQLLIDVLRASGKKEIFALGLNHIPSYGIGRNLPRLDWQGIITQLINQGLLEIDYTERSVLKLTKLSDDVLNGQTQITLTRQQAYKDKITSPQLSKTDRFKADYIQSLKALRKELASREDVPAYMIFSDKVLEEIFHTKPVTIDDLLDVPGIGAFKWRKYGRALIETIQHYTISQNHLETVKGKSQLHALQLWREGHTPEEIAEEKQIKTATVYTYLATLHEKGEVIDLRQYLKNDDLSEIKSAWEQSSYSQYIKELVPFLTRDIPFYQLRIAMAILRRENQPDTDTGAQIVPLKKVGS